jgi:hypothetical protein
VVSVRPRNVWPFWPAYGIFATAWLILSWPWLSGRITIPWDAKAHFYPQLQFLAQSIHGGASPSWAPFVFSGSPQIADPQSLLASPPFLLLALIDPNPSFRAADAAVLAMLGLGGMSMLAMFRDRGWHPVGGLVAALSYSFGASAAWRLQHIGQVLSLCFLAIALWLTLRALERRSCAYGFLSGVAAGFMVLGRDQVAYLGTWLLASTVLCQLLSARSSRTVLRDASGPLLSGALSGVTIVAVPVGLTLLLSEDSNRPALDLTNAGQGSLHPALLLTAVIPNLFGADGPFVDYWGPPSPRWGPVDLFLARNMGVLYLGALPIALVVIGALRGVLWRPKIRAFAILTVIMLLYALGRYTPFFQLAFYVAPGIDLFRRPADAAFVLGALISILAGFVAHCWWTGNLPPASRSRRIVELVILTLPFAAGGALAWSKGTLALASGPLAKAAACLVVGLAALASLPRFAARAPASAIVVLLALNIVDLAWNNGPNESTALSPETYDVLDPQSRDPILETLRTQVGRTDSNRLDRIELTGLGFHWPNASLVHRLHNVLGYNPVRLGLYSSATGAQDHVALPEQRRFSALFPSYRCELANLLGLRFIATGIPIELIDPKLEPGDLTLLASFPHGFIYENPRAMPRVLFATRAQTVDFGALLRTGAWPDVNLYETVLLPRKDGASDGLAPQASGPLAPTKRQLDASPEATPPERAKLHISTYSNTEIIIDVDAITGGYLVLNDPYHPWWFAEIDGQWAKIFQANVLFRAVAVPKGQHKVRFTFRPLRGAWQQFVAQVR